MDEIVEQVREEDDHKLQIHRTFLIRRCFKQKEVVSKFEITSFCIIIAHSLSSL